MIGPGGRCVTGAGGWVGRLGVVAATLAAGALLPAPAHAQDYRFNVPRLDMASTVLAGGDVETVYDITFENAPGADPIDVVDIGMPHDDYDIGTMTASVDGAPLDDIRKSEYIDTGVEVHFDGAAIPPGGSGTLRFSFRTSGLLYEDTTRDGYASMQLVSTFFDPSLIMGAGDVRIVVTLPDGVPPDAVLYQDVPFDAKVEQDGRTTVYWQFLGAPVTRPHRVGVSFPSQGFAVRRQSPFDLAVKWLDDNPLARLGLIVVCLGILGVGFFRFTGGTGCSVFGILAVLSLVLFVARSGSVFVALAVFPVLVYFMERARRRRIRRHGAYLPPIAQVEGGGIKRGLTAPEAAVLLELPLHKVLSLVVFGLLKKGVLNVTSPEPLAVALDDAYASAGDDGLRVVAQDKGTVLHPYELPFLAALKAAAAGTPVAKIDLTPALKGLIEHVATRVAGFDLSDTQDYYRDIVRRATVEAKSAVDLPEREEVIERNFDWILLDEAFGEVLDAPGRPYSPRWWPRGHVGGGRVGVPVGVPGAPARSDTGGRTGLGDVAASFAGWAESTMGGLADAVSPTVLTLGGESLGGGAINLSGVDRVTMDVLQSIAESAAKGGSGGGGGGGCACAGCACACACAGGGR